MNKKEALLQEAQMQNKALKTIELWLKVEILISTIGITLIYFGMIAKTLPFAVGILGIAVTAIGVITALVTNLGLRNGKRNVEHILKSVNVRK